MRLEFFLATPNLRPSTGRRAMLWIKMGSGFSCTSSLHSPTCPTFPCKKLLHGLLSVPDFISSSHSSQKQHLDSWKSKPTLSQGLVDKNIAMLPTSSFKICNSDLGSPEANLFLRGGTVGGDLLGLKVFVAISEVLPKVNSVKRGCALLLAICLSWKWAPCNQQSFIDSAEGVTAQERNVGLFPQHFKFL